METVHLWSVDKAMSCLQNKALIRKGIPPTPFHLLLLPQYQGVCVSQRGWLSASPWDTGAGQSVCPLFCPPHLTSCCSWELPANPLGGHVSKCMSGWCFRSHRSRDYTAFYFIFSLGLVDFPWPQAQTPAIFLGLSSVSANTQAC